MGAHYQQNPVINNKVVANRQSGSGLETNGSQLVTD